MSKSDASRLVFSGTVTVLALSGCAVGPNYHPPAAPAGDSYTAETLPAQTASGGSPGGQPQHFQVGGELPGEWWTLFGSEPISALVAQALASYPDIAASQAALREARASMRAEAGAFLPQVQGSANATRSEISGGAIFPGLPNFISNVFSTAVNVSYTFDVFGKERRTVEGLAAQEAQQRFQLEASYLTLTSNVVSTAIQVASTRAQIEATREIIGIEDRQLGIARRRFELGSRTQADVLQQQSALASVRATLPPLQQQLAAAEHALAVLCGRLPKDAPPLRLTLADLTLPTELPVSLPSALVAHRPDVRAQEEALHAATAQIGVATANMLPQLTLTGSFGDETLHNTAKLIDPSSNIWNLAGGLTAPIFQGGTLKARRQGAVAAYDRASAQYRLVVLQGFQNVADTLAALHNDAQALEAQKDALEAARAGLDLIQKQYQIGAADYVSLLTAQQTYQQALLAWVRATAARYTDTVALFQALGGGWWNRDDPQGGSTVAPAGGRGD